MPVRLPTRTRSPGRCPSIRPPATCSAIPSTPRACSRCKEFGNIYTRLMNPTTDVLEKRLAAIHGATGAVATASGQAAIFYAIAAITSAGQNFVTGDKLYGGTYTQFTFPLKRFGIEARFVDSRDPANFEKAIDENTRLLYTESIGNPKGNVDDLAAIAEVAHRHRLPLVVDNTVTPPPLFNPFESRGRHRRVLAHQDDRRSRHLDRRRHRGEGRLRLEDGRQVSGDHRTGSCLPRRELLGCVREPREGGRSRPGVRAQDPHRSAARPGRGAVAVQLLAVHPGSGDAAPAGAGARGQRSGRGQVPRAATRR